MKTIFLIHRYGLHYSIGLYVILMFNKGISIKTIDFWLFLFCLCLNLYFAFQKGMTFAMVKQIEDSMIKAEVIKSIAGKTLKEIKQIKKDENKED